MGHSETDWLILDYRCFYGPIDGEAVWQDLDSLLRETWQHPNGGTLRIDACAVDSGDGALARARDVEDRDSAFGDPADDFIGASIGVASESRTLRRVRAA